MNNRTTIFWIEKDYEEMSELGYVGYLGFVGRAVLPLSLLTIGIACMGMFGLIALFARRRVKEIGVRKVLGASVFNITSLLSKDFIRLVAIAVIIASPVAWWLMSKWLQDFSYRWLQDFAYRIDIQWWMFAAAGLIAIVIALVTVSFQAIKAAIANPVKSLRTE